MLLNQLLPDNIRLRYYNIDSFINHYPEFNFKYKDFRKLIYTEASFYRLIIPIIMPKYKKVCYMDSDILIASNLNDIYNIDFDNNQLLAVRDLANIYYDFWEFKWDEHCKRIGLKTYKNYFNSGVLMFNIENRISTEEYIKKMQEAYNNKNIILGDQDILNIIFENRTKLIDFKYNYMVCRKLYNFDWIKETKEDTDREILRRAMNDPSIIHYIGNSKPWIEVDGEFAPLFYYYARKTPYYEQILFDMMNRQSQLNIERIKQIKKYKLRYSKYKILHDLAKGQKKEIYKNKYKLYKEKYDYADKIEKSF